MQSAAAKGRKAVCGWEANGGFLLGSDLMRGGKALRSLPTRDAFLPIIAVLFSAKEKGVSVSALFDQLPKRFSRAALLRNFPRPASQRILARFVPADEQIKDVVFENEKTIVSDAQGKQIAIDAAIPTRIRSELESFFNGEHGFGRIVRINYIDGVRMYFSNGDVAHVRPSGNADELRIYAVADTQERANAITQVGVAEPDGLLRQLERATGG